MLLSPRFCPHWLSCVPRCCAQPKSLVRPQGPRVHGLPMSLSPRGSPMSLAPLCLLYPTMCTHSGQTEPRARARPCPEQLLTTLQKWQVTGGTMRRERLPGTWHLSWSQGYLVIKYHSKLITCCTFFSHMGRWFLCSCSLSEDTVTPERS